MRPWQRSPALIKVGRFLWAATLLTLPVTSFRFFPAGEGTYVRPLSFFPLALLLAVIALQLLRGVTALPRAEALTPLAALILVVLATSLIGILLAPVPMRDQVIGGRILRAWITLIMGIAFFVAAIWMNRDEAGLRFSIRWLLAGFVLDVLWSGVQASTFYLNLLPKSLVTHWQRAFSLRELIRTNRISGLAYEPSWLAGQIATVYLPWLLAGLLTQVRITRWRWLEPALFVIAGAMVVATFSRGGMLTAAFSVTLTLLLVGRDQIVDAWHWFASGFARGRDLMLRLVLSAIAIGSLAGMLIFLGQKGYISRLWEAQASNIPEFLIQNSAGARGAYLASALQVYEEHPWTGVGLGASGLYLYNHLPDWALTTVPEIARQLSPESSLYPNPKNLYVRLLAETGLLGMLLYLAFQFSLLGDSVAGLRRGEPTLRYVAIAGLCTWLALLVYNVTQDSLATPNLWINLGILAGMSGLEPAGRRAVNRRIGRLQQREAH